MTRINLYVAAIIVILEKLEKISEFHIKNIFQKKEIFKMITSRSFVLTGGKEKSIMILIAIPKIFLYLNLI